MSNRAFVSSLDRKAPHANEINLVSCETPFESHLRSCGCGSGSEFRQGAAVTMALPSRTATAMTTHWEVPAPLAAHRKTTSLLGQSGRAPRLCRPRGSLCWSSEFALKWRKCDRMRCRKNSFGVGAFSAPRRPIAAAHQVASTVTEDVDMNKLVAVVKEAATTGSQVVMAAVDQPRNIDYKGTADLVTDTDKNCEDAMIKVLRNHFPDHLILGEEGGVSGSPSSEYLWCLDPLDGTTNFAQNYPSFGVSIAVLRKGKPIAASVVEFAGGPFIWATRVFTASAGGGAFCNGKRIQVSSRDQVERSLFVTGFGYVHDDSWAANMELFKEFTDISRGVRRLGAASVDMCHIALGVAEAYWEYYLKPWDMAAGVLIVEEAGGKVTRMDGGDFCVFERSVLVSNGVLHDKLLERIAPPTQKLSANGFDFTQWYKPDGYICEV